MTKQKHDSDAQGKIKGGNVNFLDRLTVDHFDAGRWLDQNQVRNPARRGWSGRNEDESGWREGNFPEWAESWRCGGTQSDSDACGPCGTRLGQELIM
jgi:hypothetical protein